VARRPNPLLVDTNVIIEAFRSSSWKALTGGYSVETVETCVIETQTGYQRRRREVQIEEAELRAKLAAVHKVTDAQRAEALIRGLGISLDPGELDLWAHATTRKDAWFLCGPDKASLRFGIRVGFRDRLVSLERLLEEVGFPVKGKLRGNYTAQWHSLALNELVLTERGVS
jgi:predicted nucleic acid-binding protein